VAYIKGVQSEGVIATVKHFAANNQEFERHRINAVVDERALHEIYFPAFKAAVEEAGVWSVMSAYNKLNGVYCAENPFLLKDVLQKQWDFKGFVVSDWGSTYSTVATVNAGMDLEMPGGEPMKEWLKRAEDAGGRQRRAAGWFRRRCFRKYRLARYPRPIDDNVGRMLRVMFVSGQFDKPHTATGEIDTPEQRAVARKAATESIVLLKNAGDLLPLDPSKIHSLVVIGPNAAMARTGGGGSSLVTPRYSISPLKGIQDRAGESASELCIGRKHGGRGSKQRYSGGTGAASEKKPSALRPKQMLPSSWWAGIPNLSQKILISSRSICRPGRTNSSQPWRRSIRTPPW
jgi:beta-glucosidase